MQRHTNKEAVSEAVGCGSGVGGGWAAVDPVAASEATAAWLARHVDGFSIYSAPQVSPVHKEIDRQKDLLLTGLKPSPDSLTHSPPFFSARGVPSRRSFRTPASSSTPPTPLPPTLVVVSGLVVVVLLL